jgi:hypothetical protein
MTTAPVVLPPSSEGKGHLTRTKRFQKTRFRTVFQIHRQRSSNGQGGSFSGAHHLECTVRIGAASVFALVCMCQAAHADCSCQCIDGRMQPVCSNLDVPPRCPLTFCPLGAPTITPPQVPTVPPAGTRSCRQIRVCDTLGNCRLQRICN